MIICQKTMFMGRKSSFGVKRAILLVKMLNSNSKQIIKQQVYQLDYQWQRHFRLKKNWILGGKRYFYKNVRSFDLKSMFWGL